MFVVVVGFGAAGVCAALEAAESGAEVLVVDRFTGGGATAVSGGIVYAGGGTRQQRAAGVSDSPSSMYDYLRHETRDAVAPATLRRFCDGSADMLAWLEDHGVPFDASLCPYKTSYPTDRHYLYQSGSEHAYPAPAPRGHRTHASGTSGGTFHARLAAAARSRRVRFLTQTRAVTLLTSSNPSGGTAGAPQPHLSEPTPDASVAGVICRTLREAPGWARFAHRWLHRWSVKPGMYVPGFGRALHRVVTWIEDRYGRELRIPADAVILAAGGFVFDRAMMREHAPGYRGLRLGTPGDDGSGIRLGTAVGAGTRHLDRVTLWRFLTPPSALLGGVLVDSDGRRICDESRYGAAIGDAVHARPDGKAWLLLDATVLREAWRQLPSQTMWFQRWQSWWLFTARRTSAPTLAKLARRAGIDETTLIETVAANNAASAQAASAQMASAQAASARAVDAGAGPDPVGKPAELVRPLVTAPFSLVDVSLRAVPAPMLTLGGLTVDEETGQVLRPSGVPIPGLYAAGRTAVGICSASYVSGLSLADCVFSGRRAGHHASGSASAGAESGPRSASSGPSAFGDPSASSGPSPFNRPSPSDRAVSADDGDELGENS